MKPLSIEPPSTKTVPLLRISATPSVPAARKCTNGALRSTLTPAARTISATREAPVATSQTVSPAVTHSRTCWVNISMRRLKCSEGRVSSTNASSTRGSQTSSPPPSMPPVMTSTRRPASRWR